jgi:hypothetical protein
LGPRPNRRSRIFRQSPVCIQMAARPSRSSPRCADAETFLSGFAPQSYQNVSRETFWYDWGRKPYKPADVLRLAARGIARKSRPVGLFETMWRNCNNCGEFLAGRFLRYLSCYNIVAAGWCIPLSFKCPNSFAIPVALQPHSSARHPRHWRERVEQQR